MANSDKDIRIVTNRNKSALPNISFTGYNNDPIVLNVLDDNTISFEGSSGQLFSVSNAVTTGTIFSVNDISGIPSFRIDADGTVGIAEFSGNVGIGLQSPQSKLSVGGDINASIGFSYRINGTMVLNSSSLGTGVTLSSLTSVGTISSGTWQGSSIGVLYGGTGATNASDARSFLGAATAGTNSDLTRLLGVQHLFVTIPTASAIGITIKAATSQSANMMEFVNSSNSRLAFITKDGTLVSGGYVAHSDGRIPGVSVNGNSAPGIVVRGSNSDNNAAYEVQNNPGSLTVGLYPSGLVYGGVLQAYSSTASTNATTGALIVAGGAGIANTVNIGRDLRVFSSLASSSPFTGALVVSGGVGISNNLFVGGGVAFTASIASTSSTTGTLVVTGGVGIGGTLFSSSSFANSLSGVILNNGSVSLTGTYTQSNSSTTAFSVKDGSNTTAFNIDTIGDIISLPVAVASTSTGSGSLVVAGGVGIGGTLNVNTANIVRDFNHTPNITTIGGASGWVASTASTFISPGTFRYLNNKYIGIGGTYIYYSDDMLNWSSVMVPNLDPARSIANITYGEGKYVFVQYYTANAGYSTNLTNWTNVAITYQTWNDVIYGNGRFVATVGGDLAAYSLDGTSWTSVTDSIALGYNTSLKFLNGYFYVTNSNAISRSIDGITWQACNTPAVPNGLAYGNGLYVGGVYNSGTIVYSYDGLNFSSYSGSSFVHNNAWFYNGIYYLTTNNNQVIRYSTDGFNWTNSTGFSSAVFNLQYIKGFLYAASGSTVWVTNATPGRFEVNPLRTGTLDSVEIGRLSPNNANFIDVSVNNNLNVSSKYSSTSPLNGALTVAGGVGIGGSLYVSSATAISGVTINAGVITGSLTGTASTATYSHQSGYGISSGTATTATYAHQSGYATTSGSSGLATTATYAHQSGYATTSGFATSATSATSAASASIATTSYNVNVVSASSNSSHYLIFSPNATGSGVALSTESALVYNPSTDILSVSGLAVTSSLGSTSTSTGALTVSGGVGIGGTLNILGNSTIGGTLNVSGSNSYFQNNLYVGNNTQGRLFFSQATLGSAGTTVIPSMAFIGATNSPITLSVLPDNSLSFDGSSGQLFSINNNLSTGWIFSINDISGLPIFRTNADLNVAMGEYGGNVGIGLSNAVFKLQVVGNAGISGTTLISNTTSSTNTTSGALVVSGGVGIGGSLFVSSPSSISSVTINAGVVTGNLTGTATTATYSNQSGYAITSGFATSSTSASIANTAYSVNANSASSNASHFLIFSPSASGSGVALSTESALVYNPSTDILSVSGLAVTSSSGSTSSSTGALIVTGGVGIGGTLFSSSSFANSLSGVVLNNGSVSLSGTFTQSNSSTTAFQVRDGSNNPAFVIDTIGDVISLPVAVASTSTGTGSLVVAGGVGIGGTLNVNRLKAISKFTFEPGTGTSAVSGWTGIGLTSISKMIYGGGKFVGVGGSYVAYSTDGVNFTYTTIPGSTSAAAYNDIAYGNGVYVAVNTQDVAFIAYSYDAVGWGTSSIFRGLIRTVGFGNGRFLAFSEAPSAVYSSTDGRNWSAIGNLGEYGREVTFANGYFLSSRGVSLYYSKDGASWKMANTPGSNYIFASTYGKGIYLAADYNSAQYFTSPDLINWTQRPIDNKVWTGASYVNGVFYLVPNNNNYLHHSLDGINWSSTNFGTPIGGTQKFFTANDRLYFLSSYGPTLWSTDATTGTLMAKPFYNGELENTRIGAVNPDSATFTHLTAFNDVSFTSATASTSFDSGALTVTGGVGIGQTLTVGGSVNVSNSLNLVNTTTGIATTWSRSFVGTGATITYLAYANNLYVGVGYSSITSTDGVNWTTRTLPNNLSYVAYGNGIWSGILYNSALGATSTNGTSWTAFTLPQRTWSGIAFGNGIFVAIFLNSITLAYSRNGYSWTEISIPTSYLTWTSITFGGGYFLAIANASTTAIYSTDGINWTTTTLPSAAGWNSVTYGNGYFYVTGSSRFGVYSKDLINWTSYSTTVDGTAYVAYNNGAFVVADVYGATRTNIITGDFTSRTQIDLPGSQIPTTIVAGDRNFIAGYGQTFYTFPIPNNSVSIFPNTTGEINNVEIGNTKPASGAFSNIFSQGLVAIGATTRSTTPYTGALVVAGGVGIGGSLYVSSATAISGVTINAGVITGSLTGLATTATYANQSGYATTSGLATSATLASIATTSYNVNVNSASSNSSHFLVFSPNATGSGVALSTESALVYNPSTDILSVSGLAVTSSLGSTSTSTGALIITGGVGIGQSLFTSTSYASSISGAIFSNGSATLPGTFTQNNSSTTAFQVRDGSNNPAFVIDTIGDVISLPVAVASTSTGTGSLVVAGGVGIGQSVNIGGKLDVSNTINYTATNSGIANTWTRIAIPSPVSISGLTYGNGLYVGVGYSAATSTDGITWTARTLPHNLTTVKYGNNLYVGVNYGSALGATSTDGITWRSMSLPSSANWDGIAYGNGIYVITATYNNNLVAYSYNGFQWTLGSLPIPGGLGFFVTTPVIFGGGYFYTGGYSGAYYFTSVDGINWTLRTGLNAVATNNSCYGDGTWLLTGSSASLAYTKDLTNWTYGSHYGYSGQSNVAAYTNGTFAIVDFGSLQGTLIYKNLSTVVATTLPGPSYASTITAGEGKFVAGAGSTVYVTDIATHTFNIFPNNSGELNNVRIGAKFPSSAQFTVLSTSGLASVGSSAGSASTTTGALVVKGGVGIGGSLFVGNTLSVGSSTASTSATSGALIVSGGVGIGGSVYTDSSISVGTLNAPSTGGPVSFALAGLASTGNLLASTTYYYKISAIDYTGGESLPSNESSVTLTGSQNAVIVTTFAQPGVLGYRIYRTASSGIYTTSFIATTYPSNAIANINQALTYYFYDYGITASAIAPLSTSTFRPVSINRSTFSNFGNVNIHRGNLVVNTPNYSTFTNEAIEVGNGNQIFVKDHTSFYLGSLTASTGGTLTDGTTYYYKFSAVDFYNNETFTGREFAATAGTGGAITLNFGGADQNVAAFRIYRSTTPGNFTNSYLGQFSTSFKDINYPTSNTSPPTVSSARALYLSSRYDQESFIPNIKVTPGGNSGNFIKTLGVSPDPTVTTSGTAGSLIPGTTYYYKAVVLDIFGNYAFQSDAVSVGIGTFTSTNVGVSGVDWPYGYARFLVFRSTNRNNFSNSTYYILNPGQTYNDVGDAGYTGTPSSSDSYKIAQIGVANYGFPSNYLRNLVLGTGGNSDQLTAVNGTTGLPTLQAATGGTLVNGQTYYYRVESQDVFNYSAFSSPPVKIVADSGGAVRITFSGTSSQNMLNKWSVFRSTSLTNWSNSLLQYHIAGTAFTDYGWATIGGSPNDSSDRSVSFKLNSGRMTLADIRTQGFFIRQDAVYNITSTPGIGGSLSNNSTYYYRIAPISWGNYQSTGQLSDEIVVSTGSTQNSITLSWNSSYGACAYDVYRTTTRGNYSNVPYYTVTNTSFVDNGQTTLTKSASFDVFYPGSQKEMIHSYYGNNLSHLTIAGESSFLKYAMQAPRGLSATTGSGGTLPNNTTYFYVVEAYDYGNNRTLASNPVQIDTGANNAVTLSWNEVLGASYYKIYRNASLGSFTNSLINVVIKSNSFTDINYPVSNTSPQTNPNYAGSTLFVNSYNNNYSLFAPRTIIQGVPSTQGVYSTDFLLKLAAYPARSIYGSLLELGDYSNDGYNGSSDGTYLGIASSTGFSGDYVNFQASSVSRFKINNLGNTTIGSTTGSGSTSTGALVVSGGVGIGQSLFTSPSFASSISGAIFSNGSATLSGTFTQNNTSTTAFQVRDASSSTVLSIDTLNDIVNLPIAIASTTTGTGSLVVAGGVGIGGSVNVGGRVGIGTNLLTGQINIRNSASTVPSIVIQGATSQSEDYLRIVSSTGTTSLIIDSSYKIAWPNSGTNPAKIYGTTYSTQGRLVVEGNLYVSTGPFIVNTGGGEASMTSTAISFAGGVGFGYYSTNIISTDNSLRVQPTSTSVVPIVINAQNASWTSGNLFLIQNNGSNVFSVNYAGSTTILSTVASTNPTTGALVVSGGVGISGQLSFSRASFGFTGITTNPTMSFIGATSSAPITLSVLTDNSLSWEGSSGQLFSIDNNLSSGEIFSVSDISGLPIISASSGQTVTINEFGGFTRIGNGSINSSSTSTGSLQVSGGLGVTGNSFIGGTVSITNTTNSTSTSSGAFIVSGGVGIGGSLFTSSSNASSISGVILNNGAITNTGTITSTGVMTLSNSSATAFQVRDGSDSSKFDVNTIGGIVSVLSSTASTSSTTGSLVVTGGVGIGGTLNVGGSVNVSNSINLVNTTTGIATTWTKTEVGTGATITFLTYANNLYVGVGYSSITSTDGINWTTRTLPHNLNYVTYGNGIWSGIRSGTATGATSTNGTSWTSFSLPNSRVWGPVKFGNGKFVIVAYGTNIAAYSTDGYNWTETTLPTGNLNWIDLTFGGGYFVAIARGSSTAVCSTDGINWSTITLFSFAGYQLNGISYGNGYFYITFYGGGGIRSRDLFNWSDSYLTSSLYEKSAYNNGTFVVVATPPSASLRCFIITNDFGSVTEINPTGPEKPTFVTAGDRNFIAGYGQTLYTFPIPNNSVSIFPNTTGEINNVEIGNTKPASGSFSNIYSQGLVAIGSTVRSISPYTGALVVNGGVGIGGSLYVASATAISGVTINSGVITGSLTGTATTATYANQSGYAITSGSSNTSGYATTSGTATTSQNINVVSASTSASHPVLFTPATGTASGAAVSTESTFVYNPSTDILSVSGLAITSGTASTNPTTGALVVTGGVGISGNLRIGEEIFENVASIGIGGSDPTILLKNTYNGPDSKLSGLFVYNDADISAIFSLSQSYDSPPNLLTIGTYDGDVTFNLFEKFSFFSNNYSTDLLEISGTGVSVFNTAASTSSTNGAFRVIGGVGIGKTSYFGQDVKIQGTTNSSSPTTGALVVTGGVGIGGSLFTSSSNASSISGVILNNGAITNTGTITSTGVMTLSNSSATAFQVRDGSNNARLSVDTIGGVVSVSSSTASTNTLTGALVVGGGLGVSGDVFLASLPNSKLSVMNSFGDEGGEIFLNKPATNTTITNGVTIDIYQNRLRFFEQGGSARGFYLDITAGGNSAGTNLVGGGSGTVSTLTAGTGISFSTGATITTTGTIRARRPLVTSFCAGYTPAASGADSVVIRLPDSPSDGTSAITYKPQEFHIRVETPSATTTTIQLEKYTGTGAFSGTAITSVSISGGSTYEAQTSVFAGAGIFLTSGDKLRINFTALSASHANFSVYLELEEV